MIQSLRIVWAFLGRDAAMAYSYKLDFVLRLFQIAFTIILLYYVARFIPENQDAVEEFGGFEPFVIVGLAVVSYFQTGFRSFSNAIRQEQMMGTLEAMLMSPARIPMIVIASSVWNFCWATVTAVTFLVFASLVFEFPLQGNPFSALLLLILMTMFFASLGVMSASFIMVFKRGDPIGYLIGTITVLLGEVFFPLEWLPEWVQQLARALPFMHALESIRAILLQGRTLWEVLPQLTILLAFNIVFIPLSLLCFKKAIQRAQREGTLLQY